MINLFFFLLVFNSAIEAQYDSLFTKQQIIELSSKKYFGRGVYKDGDNKAAKYIDSVLHRLRVTEVIHQEFSYNSNLFRASDFMSSGRSFILGKDYLPYPYSGSGSFENEEIEDISYGLLLEKRNLKSKVVLLKRTIEKGFLKENGIEKKKSSLLNRLIAVAKKGVKAILIDIEDFQFSYAHYQFNIPIMQVKKIDITQKFSLKIINKKPHPKKSTNLIATINGKNNDSIVVLMAHYDHLGAITDNVFFPGANDNASGTGLLLNLAKTYVKKPLHYKTVFLFFAAEEVGLLGSKYFVENPMIDLGKIKIVINLDMVASAKRGRMIQAGVEFPEIYKRLTNINNKLQLGQLSKRKNKANSDQHYFIEKGVKGIFIYTNYGLQPYHSQDDIYQTLDYDELEKTYKLIETFLYRYY